MLAFVLAIITSLPSLILTGGLGAGLPVLGMLGVLKDGWVTAAKWVGLVLLLIAAFIMGYRIADERAADAATIARLESQVGALTRQLGDIKLVETFADSEREQLRAGKADALKLADAYKTNLLAKLAEKPAVQKVTVNACALDDDDLRFRGELRQRARAKR